MVATVTKRGREFRVEGALSDSDFWSSQYSTWEDLNFAKYDELLTPGCVFVDIGGWNGCTAIYCAQLCSRVVTVECDPHALCLLRQHVALNARNVTVVAKAVKGCGQADAACFVGRNVPNCGRLGDSMSQTRSESVYDDDVLVESVSLGQVLRMAGEPVGCVKVDIEGGEEDLLAELLEYRDAPVMLSLHLHWWRDRNLLRFALPAFLREAMEAYPFGTFLLRGGDSWERVS